MEELLFVEQLALFLLAAAAAIGRGGRDGARH